MRHKAIFRSTISVKLKTKAGNACVKCALWYMLHLRNNVFVPPHV